MDDYPQECFECSTEIGPFEDCKSCGETLCEDCAKHLHTRHRCHYLGDR